MNCILAAGVLKRYLRGRTRRRVLELRPGAAVLRSAACAANSCGLRHGRKARTVNDAFLHR